MDKQLTDDIRDIDLGYNIHLASWNSETDDIWPDWMKESDNEKYQADINRVRAYDRVVWYGEDLTITINYPLQKEYTFKVSGPLTRQQLAEVIQKHYKKIYASEESIARWGVWGHGLEDLILHTVYVYKDGKAEVGVDS